MHCTKSSANLSLNSFSSTLNMRLSSSSSSISASTYFIFSLARCVRQKRRDIYISNHNPFGAIQSAQPVLVSDRWLEPLLARIPARSRPLFPQRYHYLPLTETLPTQQELAPRIRSSGKKRSNKKTLQWLAIIRLKVSELEPSLWPTAAARSTSVGQTTASYYAIREDLHTCTPARQPRTRPADSIDIIICICDIRTCASPSTNIM